MAVKTLLCVDDEIDILNALKRQLRKEQYNIITVSSTQEALTILAKTKVQVVMSDYRMTKMNGVEFLAKVKQMAPDAVRLVLSGYADNNALLDAINIGEIYRFIPKPWNDVELKQVLRQCFEYHELKSRNATLTETVQRQNQQLEDLLGTTSHALQWSQSILEKIPLALMGVDTKGNIILINERMKSLLDSTTPICIGNSLEQLFSHDISYMIMTALKHGSDIPNMKINLNNTKCYLQTKVLHAFANGEGCLIIIKEHKDVEPAARIARAYS